MRIIRIELFRYRPFLHSEIETFEMDMPDSIQNIIGTNGSGKTSLLNELNPQPAIRTDYDENGYKKIILHHGNSEYILSSDFSNVSSPHSFVKDLEELNPSGTTAVQEELVNFHLGYTSQVHSICYGKFPLSRMQVGIRKTYLLTAHPCQMKIILDYHKKVNAALRGCRSNLVMLQERRASLASQLIEDSVKESLMEENNKLTNELGLVVDATHKLTNQKSNIQKELNEKFVSYEVKSLKEIMSLRPKFTKYKSVPRDVPIDIVKNSTNNEISILSTKIESLSTRARDLTLEIDKYEQHIKQNDAKGALDLIESSILTLEVDIEELQKQKIENPFDHYVLDKIPQQINHLTDLVSFFIGYSSYIPSMKEVYCLREKLERTNSAIRHVREDFNDILLQLSKYEKELLSTQIDNIPSTCGGCILFENYRNSLMSAQKNYDMSEKKNQLIQLKKKRIELIYRGRSEKLKLWEQAVPQLQKISDYINENRYLLIALKDVDILQTLRRNPSSILVKIQTHYNLSQAFYDLKKKRELLDKLIIEQEKLKTPSEFGEKFLKEMVVEKHRELSVIRDEFDTLIILKKEKIDFLSLLNGYQEDLNSVQSEYAGLKALEVVKTLEHEKASCELYINHLSQIKYQVVNRLTEIDRILKEQDSILARYRDEIMVNIEKITLLEKEYSDLETALSPTTGIAHKYMVQFLNDLFTDANIFMAEIFSYPVEFILLDENSTLDYKFKMMIGDVQIPDPSEASEGQEELINFAFNLALFIQRGQSQYGLMLDECGRTFDSYHKQRLVEFLKSIVDDGLVSQLFLINHHATISAGLLNSNTVVLNPENIVVPENYNEYVTISKY